MVCPLLSWNVMLWLPDASCFRYLPVTFSRFALHADACVYRVAPSWNQRCQDPSRSVKIRQVFFVFLPFEHFEPGYRKHMRSMNTKLPFTTILVSAPGYQLVLMQMLEARLLCSLVESGRRGRPAPGRLDAYRWVQMWAVPSLWSCCMLRFESANIPKY